MVYLREKLVRLVMLIVLLAIVANGYAQQVGVNFNGQFDQVDYDNLERSKTTWVRGFIDFFKYYEDPGLLETDPRILNYLELQDNGYKTILNIKWNYRQKSFPEYGSAEMDKIRKFLLQILDKVWGHTDIMVAGNEPFIESKPADRDNSLIPFYQDMARTFNTYRSTHDYKPIYVGAFNNLYLSQSFTFGVEEMLEFARESDWIAGIDLHIHHAAIEDLSQAMENVMDKIRPNQKILVTEFSLMKHWRSKMDETIPADFAQKYIYDAGWQNYQYIDHALKNPVPHDEWIDFLSQSYWFENRKNYLWNAYQRLSNFNQFNIANYAIRQSYPLNQDFTVNTDPWVLNGLFVNRSVQPDPQTGLDQYNYAFIEDFWKIQENTPEPTAIDWPPGEPSIAIYPNPVSSGFEIISEKANLEYLVFDIGGRKVFENKGREGNISHLSAGIYILFMPEQKVKLILVKK